MDRPGDQMSVGGELFAKQLRDSGMEVLELGDEHVMIPGYCVPAGKFERMEVDIGIVVPGDFPLSPPSGPHVHKLIHANRSDGLHPDGHIHRSADHSNHFGDGWQYWSRPHPNWMSGARNAVRYMEHIKALWESQ